MDNSIIISGKLDNEEAFEIRNFQCIESFNSPHQYLIQAVLLIEADYSIMEIPDLILNDLSIQITDRFLNSRSFKIAVDEIQYDPGLRKLLITGYDKCFELKNRLSFRVFTDQTLSSIVRKVAKGQNVVISNAEKKVPLIIQHNETDYDFLCRLADEHQLIFYSDGMKVYFGEFPFQNAVPLDHHNLNSCKFCLNSSVLGSKVGSFQIEKDQFDEDDASYDNDLGNNWIKSAIQRSFADGISWNKSTMSNPSQSEATKLLSKQVYDLHSVIGSSSDIRLGVGKRAKLTSVDKSYRVIKVIHAVSDDGKYSNQFVFVPEYSGFNIRMLNSSTPIPSIRLAMVKEIDDEMKLERVKVEFIGDENKSITPWLSCVSSSNSFFDLPGIGEKVVVYFLNPHEAIILGSIRTKTEKSGFWDNTKEKGIRFGDNFLKITDEGNGVIQLESPGEINLKAKAINLEAEQDVNIKGGKDIKQKASKIFLN